MNYAWILPFIVAAKKNKEMLDVWHIDVNLKRAPESGKESQSIVERAIYDSIEAKAEVRDLNKLGVECALADEAKRKEQEGAETGKKKRKRKNKKREVRMGCTITVPKKLSGDLTNTIFMIPNHKPNIEVRGLEDKEPIPYVRPKKKKTSCEGDDTCFSQPIVDAKNEIVIEENVARKLNKEQATKREEALRPAMVFNNEMIIEGNVAGKTPKEDAVDGEAKKRLIELENDAVLGNAAAKKVVDGGEQGKKENGKERGIVIKNEDDSFVPKVIRNEERISKKKTEMLDVWYTDVNLKNAPESRNEARSIVEGALYDSLDTFAEARDMDTLSVRCKLMTEWTGKEEDETARDNRTKSTRHNEKREARFGCSVTVPQTMSGALTNAIFMIPTERPNIEIKGLDTRESIPYMIPTKRKTSCEEDDTCHYQPLEELEDEIVIEENKAKKVAEEKSVIEQPERPAMESKSEIRSEENGTVTATNEEVTAEEKEQTKQLLRDLQNEIIITDAAAKKVAAEGEPEANKKSVQREIVIEDEDETVVVPKAIQNEERKSEKKAAWSMEWPDDPFDQPRGTSANHGTSGEKTLTEEEHDVIEEQEYERSKYHENDDLSAMDPGECTGLRNMRRQQAALDPKNMDKATIEASRAFVERKEEELRQGTAARDFETQLDEMLAFFDDIDERRKKERLDRKVEREKQRRREKEAQDKLDFEEMPKYT